MKPLDIILAVVYTAAAIIIGLDLAVWHPL